MARLLRQCRRQARLTQRALARRTGVAQPTIARIERGTEIPRVDTLDRLLRACDRRLEAVARGGAGIDRGQIREVLALSPRERLTLAAEDARGLARLEAAARADRDR